MRSNHDTEFDDLPDNRRWESRDNLFYWTIFILLLVLFTLFCWGGSYFIFGHPEKPFSYKLLKKLKKLEVSQKFELTAAPKGEFLDPKALMQKYGGMTPRALKEVNDSLLRNFIRNYKETRDLVPYITGTYSILDSFELGPNDFFPSGVVALTQATDLPMVLLENIFTSDPRVIPILHRSLLTGLNIRLEKRFDLSALIHVDRLPDGRMIFTTLPILYGSYAATHGSGSFSLSPPDSLNIKSGLPILSQARINTAQKTYTKYRQQAGLDTPAEKAKVDKNLSATAAEKQGPNIKEQLIRIEKPVLNSLPVEKIVVHNNPTTAALSKRSLSSSSNGSFKARPVPPASVEEMKVARALPAQATLTATPFPSQPQETSKDNKTATATASATPVIATASPPPPPPLPNATPVTELPSSLTATASPAPSVPAPPAVAFTNVASGNWQTYNAGQMPLGRLLEPSEVQNLAENGLSDERVYLKGSFLVTAARANRAVFRPQNSNAPLGNSSSKVRIIVEFPSNAKTPELGATVSRGAQRPFLITDVQKAPGGMVNVFVREVTHD